MRILILGCGWVGEFVAQMFLAAGHEVHATTRSTEKCHRLIADGIFAYTHDFDQQDSILKLPYNQFDWVLNSVPATQKNTEEELQYRFFNVQELLRQLQIEKLIFLSSIGVYPDISAEIDETTCSEQQLDPKLYLAEQMMSEAYPEIYIFRLGGLFGLNRIFAKYFEHRICETGDQPANFIHVEDVAQLIKETFSSDLPKGIYNLVCPAHPSKKEVILASAQKYNYAYPKAFNPKELPAKVVLADRIRRLLNYNFVYQSPIDF